MNIKPLFAEGPERVGNKKLSPKSSLAQSIPSQSSTSVNFSLSGKSVGVLDSSSDIDQERVNEVTMRIAKGELKIDSDRIAKCLLEEMETLLEKRA